MVEPRSGDEESDPDQGVHALSLQERDRIALAQRGRRRGGAEDHHEAERDQGEGDEDEQALLELAPGADAPGPCVRECAFTPRFCTSLLNSSPRCS